MQPQGNRWILDNRNNQIHTTALVGEEVEMGYNNCIGPFSVVGGMGCPVTLGDHNYIGANCVLGSPPENARELPGSALIRIQQGGLSARVNGIQAGLAIGSMVVVRDSVTIHSGTRQSTRVSDLAYVHSRCHIDHDSVAEVGAVLAPGVTTGGRVSFGPFSQTGLDSALHQDTLIGAFSMIGMNSTVKGTVKPFTLNYGSPSRYRGLNLVRLKRLGLNISEIEEIESLVRPDALSENQFRLETIIENLVVKSIKETMQIWTSWK